jgi:GlpG protein
MSTAALAIVATGVWWSDRASEVSRHLAGVPSDVWRGRAWVLVTSCLVHGDPIHLLFNLYWVWTMWVLLEAHATARWKCLAFGIAAGAFASLAQFLTTDRMGIGLSGVGYAVFGLAWARSAWHRPSAAAMQNDAVKLWLGWAVACLFLTHIGVWHVANAAHFGGLAFGWITGRIVVNGRDRWIWRGAAALIAAAGIALGVSGPQWSSSWHSERAFAAMQRGDAESATEHLQTALGRGADERWVRRSLLWAYHHAGRRSDYERLWAEIQRADPELAAELQRESAEK